MDSFSDIRPYLEDEIVPALNRIAKHPLLTPILSYLFPDKEPEKVRQLISTLKSVDDFQDKVMFFAIRKIILDTVSSLSYAGITKLKDNKKHLYISNHRDILLDSGILQVIFRMNDIQTSEMAVGDNLITDPFIEDIARSNKMIRVDRGKNVRELYNSSMLLSRYIRERISKGESSVWIAQRNGRTKDGVDLTEQGLLKMLEMSGTGDFAKDFEELSLVPISISYEFEPCDLLKTKELYISRRKKYVKSPGEDLNSIISGIMQFKGNIHINFCEPVSAKELKVYSMLEKNEKFKALSEAVDYKIIDSYQLWKNNFIAYDMLFSTSKYSGNYSTSDKNHFVDYLKYKLSDTEGNPKEMEEIFLSIYANPVLSKEKLTAL
ncbi:MAG: 1-acyl-sn-glycerol-3-phosphate acyltransferase [Bacteroidales bacterium]|nr:1-acyl-sn-glycerol-3-phosphate acyltransferase [Bacteroidales bacterium]MDD2425455.1 1-acyl-sn-glycerol-3-phosphate acyltransferase [Bacteroidales bacterium]MDD3988559.1 1-acyl-sn-glycerol-3-phosphate acyltransferase [Bacteroidales bacterium]MDD4638463.1 1-acyl-sn-glycerol-3-phosphate acyltransferase [Bacteroidales bacterium]